MNYWIYFSIFVAALAIISMINVLMIRMSRNRKMLWFAIVTLVPVVGPIVYWFKRRSLAGE